MARNRTIKPSFWSDEKIGELKRDARLLYIALWNFADDYGVVIANLKTIKAMIFPFDSLKEKDIEEWLSSLEKLGLIISVEYKDIKYLVIPKFVKHQVICRPSYKNAYIPISDLSDLLEEHRNKLSAVIPPVNDTPKVVVEVEAQGEDDSYNKFNEWCKKEAPSVLKLKRPITRDEFYRLKERYGTQKMCEYLEKMDNWAPLTKRCTSAYKTVINWIGRDEQNSKNAGQDVASSRRKNSDVSADYAESILRRMVGGQGDGQI